MAEITIDTIINRLTKGANVTSPFTLLGTNPNFRRDSLETEAELLLITVENNIYDIGHIVYCEANGKHYVFRGRTCDPLQGEDATKWKGQFQELSFSGGGGSSTLLFRYKGTVSAIADVTVPIELGDAYRVDSNNFTIPAENSTTGEITSAKTGDIIVCVENDPVVKWSKIENNINLTGYIKKADTLNSAFGEIPKFNNNEGTVLESTNIKFEDVVLVTKQGQENYNPSDIQNRGGELFENSPSTNVPILDGKGNLIDSKVDIEVLRNLQKELGGTSAFTFSNVNEIKEGTLADMIHQFRENNNQLGHSYGVVSATTELNFVNQMQHQLSASTTDQGFVLPITIFPTEDPKTPYLFDEFIPVKTRIENQQVIEERYPLTVEATVRKDGPTPNNSGTAFHLDFEIAKYSLQYWYNGAYDNDSDGSIDRFDSILYFEEYGMSNNLNVSQENNETQEEP